MEKIILNRYCGKTTKLIQKSAEKGYYIVCRNIDTANSIQNYARIMGLSIPLPITYSEFIRGKYEGKRIPGFLIDDLDILIQTMSSVPIKAITITDDERI